MAHLKDLHERLISKYGGVINLKENPGILQYLYEEVEQAVHVDALGVDKPGRTAPFGVSWMDSWVAHWVYNDNLRTIESKDRELGTILRSLADLKFNERLDEMRRFIRNNPHFIHEAPDGGPPEPGTPPAGPSMFSPPDAGPPEPGTPPAGPAALEPPDGGPPEPGTPPTGPDAGFLQENPWILYWFISIKAPFLLDVIDVHMTRRLNELGAKIAAE